MLSNTIHNTLFTVRGQGARLAYACVHQDILIITNTRPLLFPRSSLHPPQKYTYIYYDKEEMNK